ncbi:MAG: GTPase Era [Firmicutes bacterium]|jgi:GTP-binding protein Era|nr:GTPase Era [Bacillota bacterium]
MGDTYRSGFVAIIGRPNVGKSTLLNRLLGQKVAIVSDKPQTTRNQIRGILTLPHAQVVFVDTPGMHKPFHLLGEYMMREVRGALSDVDLALLVVDGSQPPGQGDRFIAEELVEAKVPVLLVVNKGDRLGDAEWLRGYEALGDFLGTVVVSALTGGGLGDLVRRLIDHLPPGPQYYPEDMVSDQPLKFILGEYIREKVLELTREEVPHSVAVEVEEVSPREDRELTDIRATIYVEKDSQKGIIIGKGGQMLRSIGQLARTEMEALLERQVNLQLWVKVKKDWRHQEGSLRSLGYR